MGIRETINENPQITTGVTIGIVVVALLIIVMQLWPESQPKPQTKAWFTEDDGATLFADEMDKPVPFTGPNGNPAVKAHVYKCEKEPQQVVYLEKFSDKDVGRAEGAYSESKNNPDAPSYEYTLEEMDLEILIKKPGGDKWISIRDPKRGEITARPQCADGKHPKPVFPKE